MQPKIVYYVLIFTKRGLATFLAAFFLLGIIQFIQNGVGEKTGSENFGTFNRNHLSQGCQIFLGT
jgi:hypothetical protein